MDINVNKFKLISGISFIDNQFTQMINKKHELKKRKYKMPTLPIIIDGEEKTKKFIPDKDEIEIIDIKENDKLVSLTFEDVSTINIKALLNILNKYNSKATFFVSGKNILDSEDKIKNITDNGNEIGVLGYTGKSFTDMDIDEVNAEVAGTFDRLYKFGFNPSNIVRPPQGKLNETIKENVRVPFVLWNIDLKKEDNIEETLLDNIEPGSIIRMGNSGLSLKALDKIIPLLINKGYKFVTIDEMNKKYYNTLRPGKVYAKIREYAA